jgi:hypothetical protein
LTFSIGRGGGTGIGGGGVDFGADEHILVIWYGG